MFAPKDEKAKFRIGSKVTNDFYPGTVFKVTAKSWDVNGSLRYTIENRSECFTSVRQKDLNKA
jgi:hypothetical protein